MKWQLTVEIPQDTPDLANALGLTKNILERRLELLGVPNHQIQLDKNSTNRLVIRLPNTTDPEKLKRLITSNGRLDMFHLISPPSPQPAKTYSTEAEASAAVKNELAGSWKVLPYRDETVMDSAPNKFVVVRLPSIIDGTELRQAAASLESEPETYAVNFSLKKSGGEKLGSWSGAHINEYLAIGLDNEVRSIAFIKSQIFDQGQITGNFTKLRAEELAIALNSGPLPAQLKLVAEVVDK